MTPQTPPPGSDLLEQAHLALLRGQTQSALTLLDTLLQTDPANDEAQTMRATLIAQHAAQTEQARLDTLNTPPPSPAWNSASPTRRWPTPLIFLACLGAGVAAMFIPSRHTYHAVNVDWRIRIAFGLIVGYLMYLRATVSRL